MTLIELLVSIAVMAAGFVAVLTAFAQIEQSAASTNDQAQLASRAQRIADYVESENVAYVACTGPTGAAPSGTASYQSVLQADGVMTSSDSIVAVAQAQASGSSHVISGSSTALAPINTCATAGTSSNADYGVQQIKFQVVSPAGRSLVRVVYKRWD